jgi:hypothetical protein
MGAGANPLLDVQWTGERIYGTANISAPSATSTVIKGGGPGILSQVIVTATGTGTATFYDNASAASGNVIFVVPASAAVGTIYQVRMPVQNGIFCVSATSGPVLAVSYL